MTEMFEMVFEAVMEELELSWYELFDSEQFEIVEERIASSLGISVEELSEIDEYIAWTSEMAMDL